MASSTEIFFRRKETAREQVSLPAPLFNRCLLLLNHASTAHVFVPVRAMQFQAVIDTHEIIFVDSLGYSVIQKGAVMDSAYLSCVINIHVQLATEAHGISRKNKLPYQRFFRALACVSVADS